MIWLRTWALEQAVMVHVSKASTQEAGEFKASLVTYQVLKPEHKHETRLWPMPEMPVPGSEGRKS